MMLPSDPAEPRTSTHPRPDPAALGEDSLRSDHGRLEFDEPVQAGVCWAMSSSTLHIALRGEVCAWTVEQVQPVVLDLLVQWQPAQVVIELSQVTFADARAVGMLVQIDRLATINAAALRLSALAPAMVRVLQLCRLLGQFDITSDQTPPY